MHKFHVRFTGSNALMTVDVTFKLTAASYANAENEAWALALKFLPPVPEAPVLDMRAIHIGQCEAGCF